MSDEQYLHIRHQVTPEYAREMLELLSAVPDCDNPFMLKSIAEDMGFSIGNFTSEGGTFADILKVLRKAGFISSFDLTQNSVQLLKVYRNNRNLLPELLHFVLYTGAWAERRDGIHWGYRQVCGLLWQSGPIAIDRQRIASQVMDQAVEHLGYRPAYSANSVDGVLNWIRALEPPVIHEDRVLNFERRGFCSPELLLLGIDDLYRKNGVGYQSNLPLDAEARQYLLQLCLLEPESLERVLSWCISQFDILTADSRGAGPFALLKRPVTLEDLCI